MGCILGPIFGIIKTILAIIGLLTVIIGVIVGVCVWQLTKPPAIDGEMRQVEYSTEASESFDEKWEDFIAGDTAVFALTEEEVSSKAQDMVDQLGVPLDVERIWVNFEPGSVKCWISIKGKIGPLTLYAAAKGEVAIEEKGGKRVLWYKVDELNLPSWFNDFIEDKVEGALDIEDLKEGTYELPEDMEIDLTNISVEEIAGEYMLMIEGLSIETG
jgi:hypothetical protein